MIEEFSFGNFWSFKEMQTLNMTSAKIKSSHPILDTENIIPIEKDLSLLKSKAIYGANASGKSNFLRALHALEFMVMNSESFKLDKAIPTYDPFLLDRTSAEKSTIFEIEFIAKDKKRYCYKITFDKNAVLNEELNVYELNKKTSRSSSVFKRTGDNITIGKEEKDFGLNPNQLLLSKAGTSKMPTLQEAYRFFSTYFFYGAAQSTSFDEAMLKISECDHYNYFSAGKAKLNNGFI